jgi:hypothetical protein
VLPVVLPILTISVPGYRRSADTKGKLSSGVIESVAESNDWRVDRFSAVNKTSFANTSSSIYQGFEQRSIPFGWRGKMAQSKESSVMTNSLTLLSHLISEI